MGPIVEPTVLVTGGTGTVGRMAVEHLAHEPELKRIYVSGRKKSMKKGTGISYTGRIDSMLFGGNVDAEFVPCDIHNLDDVVNTLRKIKPGAIYNCCSMISSYWYVPLINWARKDDKRLTSRLAGHTIAKDLDLVYHLMKGVKQADLDQEPIVVNIAFPDHTNHILSKAGLDVSCGGGTTDLTATALQYLVAKKYNEHSKNVKVSLLCHHALRSAPITKDMYHLKVAVGNKDVTDEINQIEMLAEAVHMTTQGENAGITAGSGIKYLLPQMFDRSMIGNTPGPAGLTGGYPVYVDKDGVRPLVPKDLTEGEVKKIMDVGLRTDGVEKVDDQGTVYFTEDCQHLMSAYLGIDRKTMKIEECHEMTLELLAAYTKLDEEYKDIDIGRFF